MHLRMKLVARKQPLVLTAVYTGFSFDISTAIAQAVNFVRASEGSAQLLIRLDGGFWDQDWEARLQDNVWLLLKVVSAYDDEFTPSFQLVDDRLYSVSIHH